jgi:hypothetical protein
MKRIRDPIHHFLHVTEQDLKLIDHRLVQRLRWVSQLPLEQLVYPSAQHSRFEHSLGTMYLAEQAAEALVKNSPDFFAEACSRDDRFYGHKSQNDKELFVSSAKTCGLLHDIGHAPFSHTLEDACKHAQDIPYRYQHEEVGYHLAKIVLDETGIPEEEASIALQVLNKKLEDEHLTPPAIILRRLIDSDLDVDKGDYVLRDAYHCGVSYGVYDPELLWQNVLITDSFDVGVYGKAAIEAWTLCLARYKMLSYVCKHHVRNITDALLVDIISSVLSAHISNWNYDVLPIRNLDELGLDRIISKFVYWTDNTMLKALSENGGANTEKKIEMFAKRKLYKRGFQLPLSNFPNASGADDIVISVLQNEQEAFEKKNVLWNFLILEDLLPPVLEKRVQDNIKVYTNGNFESLAKYLGFGCSEFTSQESELEYPSPEKRLHVFMDKASLQQKTTVRTRLEEALANEFSL